MEKTQSLENFFQSILIGNDDVAKADRPFYIFERNEFIGQMDLPYMRRDFYKISLVKGAFTFYYADRYIETSENTLLFINPKTPFSWKLDEDQSGYCCIFTEEFLNSFEYVKDYPLFNAGDDPAIDLSEEDVETLTNIFLKMFEEFNSDFIYKFDVLRTLVLELIYTALKMQPLQKKLINDSNASQRIVNHFMELLEKQFPIASVSQQVKIRFPIDYADHLSVHINHLNRALKEITGYTTTQNIAQRLLKEARILLQHTDWNISEIGWCLGFEDLPHFINFFKKRTKVTPKAFRQQVEFNNSSNILVNTKNE